MFSNYTKLSLYILSVYMFISRYMICYIHVMYMYIYTHRVYRKSWGMTLEYYGTELTVDSTSLLKSADKVLCPERLQLWCADGVSDSDI